MITVKQYLEIFKYSTVDSLKHIKWVLFRSNTTDPDLHNRYEAVKMALEQRGVRQKYFMIPTTTPPVCPVPECKQGASILSKKGDTVRYMLTCRRHWYGLIPRDK